MFDKILNVRMDGDYLEQFCVAHWNNRWADNELVVEDVFGHLDILEEILRDVLLSSYVRPNLMHAQVDFLINHLEWDWKALAKGVRCQGNYTF